MVVVRPHPCGVFLPVGAVLLAGGTLEGGRKVLSEAPVAHLRHPQFQEGERIYLSI